MYSGNDNGPNIDPYGSPQVIWARCQMAFLILTKCFLLLKWLSISFKGTPRIPYEHNLPSQWPHHSCRIMTLKCTFDMIWNMALFCSQRSHLERQRGVACSSSVPDSWNILKHFELSITKTTLMCRYMSRLVKQQLETMRPFVVIPLVALRYCTTMELYVALLQFARDWCTLWCWRHLVWSFGDAR